MSAALSPPPGSPARTREIVTAWLLVAAWATAIQTLGGNEFSAGETSRFLGPMLAWLFPDAGPELLAGVQFLIRKTAHVLEYALLGGLAWRAWRASLRWTIAGLAFASLGLVVAVATVDELRQTAAADRQGSATDVLLDACGGALGLTLQVAIARRFSR